MSDISDQHPLLHAAKLEECEALLRSFRPPYLEVVFEKELTLTENMTVTPEACAKKVLAKLKGAAAALKKANELHETMDRSHYEELVSTETTYIARGVDKEKGRKIVLFRTGRFYRGVWRYKPSSPRADAFAAAINFWIKAVFANIPLDAHGEELQVVFILDLSEAGCLDFSSAMQLKSLEFAIAMVFPLPPVVHVVGAPLGCSMFVKFLAACMPSSMRDCIEIANSRTDIERYVGPHDTPSWWYDDDSPHNGVPYCPQDPRVNWQFDKTLQKGYAVTLAEIWNPGPWLENVQDGRLTEGAKRVESTLDTIEEESDDGW